MRVAALDRSGVARALRALTLFAAPARRRTRCRRSPRSRRRIARPTSPSSTATARRSRPFASTRRCAAWRGRRSPRCRRRLLTRDRPERGQALLGARRRRLAGGGDERLGQPLEHANARRVDADDAARRPDRRRPGAAGRRPQRRPEARPGGDGDASSSARWKKSEILEAYLNSVPYRGEIVGIEALAQTLFAKHPSGLDAQEAAIAAALVRSPNAKAADVAERACGVLKLQRLDCVGVKGLAESALLRRGGMPLGEQLAPHFARRAIDPAGAAFAGQPARRAPAALRGRAAAPPARRARRQERRGRRRRRPRQRQRRSARLGRLERRSLGRGRGRRRPGAAPAGLDAEAVRLRAGVREAADHAGDADRRFAGADRDRRGLYLPQNYDHAWKGFVSARTALGASLNVPAVRVGAMVGTDALLARLNALGLALPESAGWYGASLALGSADVSLLGLTNAYRTLANGGRYAPVALVGRRAAAAPVRVADAAARLPRHRHPRRQQRPRAHLRLGQPARDARLRGGQDRHQQGHARQLVRRLHRPLHDRRLGRQRQRRGDARRQRRQRRGAGLAVDRRLPARRRAVAAAGATGRRGARSASLRLAARAGARRVLPRRQRAGAAARRPARCARPSATASPARATAASSRSIPTFRRRRSASPSKASAARGASTAAASAPASGCAGRRGRGAIGSISSTRPGRRCRASPSRCAAPASGILARRRGDRAVARKRRLVMRIVLIDVRVDLWRPRSMTCPPCPVRTSGCRPATPTTA